MSVTNQKVVYIHKRKYTGNFLQIGIDEMRLAQQQMTYCEFVLYLYLAGNANGFKLELSQQAFENATGYKKTAYHNAVNKLIELGYLKEIKAMKNININFQKQTIEMTKTFANDASNYGSEAYNELMNAKRDFPSYTVTIVKTASKKKDSFKGLNLQYMKKYITEKSGAESERMATFNLLCGNTDDELAAKASFGEIKMWFLTQYPEIEKARQNIDEIIAKAKEARIAAKAA